MVETSLMLPDPLALNPVAPPEPEAVQVSEEMAGLRASGSVTVTPVAVEGPEFDATTVYVMEDPGTAEPTVEVTEDPWSLSVLVMPRVA
jgi:hypothetical protein